MIVGVVENPLEPLSWERHEVDDLAAFLRARFPRWPSMARIYDLEGFADWTRAASTLDPAVLAARDVTPPGQAGAEHDCRVARLQSTRGPLMVSVAPADPVTAIIAAVAVAVGVAAAIFLIPRIPNGLGRQTSPNNSLSNRTNQPRIGGRVPDIFGTVESTLDLLSVPLVTYQLNSTTGKYQECEIALLAIGRGEYDIARVRDGDTAVASISGASVEVYPPFTDPNDPASVPQLAIGAAITEQVRTTFRLNDVNGQTLNPSNLNRIQGEDNIRFVYPDTIETSGGVDFTDLFSASDAIDVASADLSGETGSAATTVSARFLLAGEIEFEAIDPSVVFAGSTSITITNGGFAGDNGSGGIVYGDVTGTYTISSLTSTKVILDNPDDINGDWLFLDDLTADRTEYRSVNFTVPTATAGINLNGSYTALSVTSTQIVLNNPSLVNSAWANLADLPGSATDYVSPILSRNSESWIGPFIVDLEDSERIVANFVAMQGLYTLSKKKGAQAALAVSVDLEVTPVNSSDTPIGAAETFPFTITGSSTDKETVGRTLIAETSFTGRCSVRARRTSPSPNEDDFGAIIDEVKWKDCYGQSAPVEGDFGDITTVLSKTIGTMGALSVKERKLNMRVTRRVPERITGSTFGALTASDSADDIISAMCLDPYIGRRSASEVDFDSIYDTVAAVKAYFGTDAAGEFGFTFDDNDISFEETIATVGQAVFCTAYRQGSVVRMTLERATSVEDSALILNARNILPGSQTRSLRFGPIDDHDGVELEYVDARDGAPLTVVAPADVEVTNPLRLEINGVRNDQVAFWHVNRAWNKAQHQNLSVDLEATAEASLIIPRDRVMIADRTRPADLQGEVEDEAGTVLTLSHEAVLDPGQTWMIFLQHIDGTVEALGVTSWTPGVGEEANAYKVTLSAAPRLPLSTEADAYARATYMIVPDGDVQTRAFIVTEREPKSGMTESVRGVNYSFLYYQHDQLLLWLKFEGDLYDSGPWVYDPVASGSPTIVEDPERGLVYSGEASSDYLTAPTDLVAPASYTKAAWVNVASLSADRSILSATAGTREAFLISAEGALRSYHGTTGNGVSAAWPATGAWHHAAATYDADSEEMSVYIDGQLVASGTATQRTLGRLSPMGLNGGNGMVGFVDNLRLWSRALDAEEIRSIYMSTLPTG